jgi:hypothetical protein
MRGSLSGAASTTFIGLYIYKADVTVCGCRFWRELHTPGTPAPFKLRGATYLEDRQKVDGGMPQFVLGSVDLVETPGPTQHISRFLPQVR